MNRAGGGGFRPTVTYLALKYNNNMTILWCELFSRCESYLSCELCVVIRLANITPRNAALGIRAITGHFELCAVFDYRIGSWQGASEW